MKKFSLLIFAFFMIFLIILNICVMSRSVLAGGLPEKGALGDVNWYVEERVGGRLFYFTHGTVVWGHEFGFYKNQDDCETDIMWLTFSSSNEKVKDFIGKEVTVLFNIDEKRFNVELDMLTAGTIGFTHVMYFANWVAGEQLIDMLMNGSNVKVQIVEPKALEVLLDIKEDEFNLEGFANGRKQAAKMCKNNLVDTAQ